MQLFRPSRRFALASVLLAALPFAAIACGGDDDSPGTTPTAAATSAGNTGGSEPASYNQLSGSVSIDGSSTVFPISEAAAEEFRGAAPGVQVKVSLSGTGGGFEKFCRGETQISNASRPIKESEQQACEAAGITPIQFEVATDALTVVVSPRNDWAQCMSLEELNLLFRDGGARKWSDVNPAWPDQDIKFYYPGPDSGTFDYFNEVIIEAVNKDDSHRSDGTPSEDDNILAAGVANDTYAVGYFGFSYYEEAGSGLKAVAVDSGNGCVEPTLETALAGEYTPLARPLFVYSGEELLASRPEVAGFLKFAIENAEQLSQDVGYIPLPQGTVDQQLEKLAPYIK